MKIKVCGLKYPENIMAVCESGVDFVGFIFYDKSPRFVNDSMSFDEARVIQTKKVGVFVNERIYSVVNTIAHYDLDFVQLHGDESPAYCEELRPNVKVIKAFGINETFNFTMLKQYEKVVDYFLFDTATPNHGGSGERFDLSLLKNYKLNIPFCLSV